MRAIDKKIFVSNGKGFSSAANPRGPQPVRKHEDTKYKQANKKNEQYIGTLMKGTMSVIDVPDENNWANIPHKYIRIRLTQKRKSWKQQAKPVTLFRKK